MDSLVRNWNLDGLVFTPSIESLATDSGDIVVRARGSLFGRTGGTPSSNCSILKTYAEQYLGLVYIPTRVGWCLSIVNSRVGMCTHSKFSEQ